jgi:hypothetical protein
VRQNKNILCLNFVIDTATKWLFQCETSYLCFDSHILKYLKNIFLYLSSHGQKDKKSPSSYLSPSIVQESSKLEKPFVQFYL